MTSQTIPPSTARFSHRSALILTALALFLLAARLPAYHEPLEWDIGTYSVIANEVVHGAKLYADIWDMKPPAIFATFTVAQLLVGNGPLCVYLLSVTAAIVTMLGVFRAAAVANRAAGFWAAAVWAAMCFEPWIGGTLPNTEVFINAAVAWAFALWVGARMSEGGAGWGRWIGIALLFAIASMYKQVAAAPAVCMGIAELLFPASHEPRRRVALRLLVMACVALIAWGAVIGYFAATGRGWLIWQTLVVYPRAYAGSMSANLFGSFALGKGISPYLAYALPAIALTIIAIAMRTKAAPRGAWVLFAGFVVGTHLAIALPGAWQPHYQQLWFVPLSIGAGWGAAALPNLHGLRSRPLATAAATLAVLVILYPQATWLNLSGEQRAQRKYGDFFVWSLHAARDADAMLLPGETFYSWTDEAYVYAAAHRRPPAAGLWKSHTTYGPLWEWLTQRTLDALKRHPPELFIHYGPLVPSDHPIQVWSLKLYAPLPGENNRHFPLLFYVRKGGALEQRLADAAPPSTRPS